MSIPSSSEEVATRQGSCPDFSSSSTTCRSSWAREPWWARAISTRPPSPRLRPASVVATRARWRGQLERGLLVVRELVQALGQALGAAAVVDEDDRRGVLADELQELRVDRRPDRAGGGAASRSGSPVLPRSRRRPGRFSDRGVRAPSCPRPGRRSPGRAPCGLPASAISHSRRGPTRNRAIRSSGRCVAESPIRWRSERRPLLGSTEVATRSLQGQRQVGAALRLGDGVDLVDDHRLGAGRGSPARPRSSSGRATPGS